MLNEATRVNATSVTLLDPIYVSDSSIVVGTGVVDAASNHRFVFCELSIKDNEFKPKIVKTLLNRPPCIYNELKLLYDYCTYDDQNTQVFNLLGNDTSTTTPIPPKPTSPPAPTTTSVTTPKAPVTNATVPSTTLQPQPQPTAAPSTPSPTQHRGFVLCS